MKGTIGEATQVTIAVLHNLFLVIHHLLLHFVILPQLTKVFLQGSNLQRQQLLLRLVVERDAFDLTGMLTLEFL
jgi:hypothetical protein